MGGDVAASPEAESDGITEQGLKTAVELRLRQSRIPVVDDSNRILVANVHVFTREGDSYAYHVGLELYQDVTVTSNGVILSAATWDSLSEIGTVGAGNLRDLPRVALEQVDEFSNAYLAVNPLP